MSQVISVLGSAWSSSHVSVTGRSTSPKTRKSHVARAVSGTEPAWSTGHLSVRYWPGGRREGSSPRSTSFSSAFDRKRGMSPYTNSGANRDAEDRAAAALVRPRRRPGRGGLPPADGLERRRVAAGGRVVRGAAPDGESARDRPARRVTPRAG